MPVGRPSEARNSRRATILNRSPKISDFRHYKESRPIGNRGKGRNFDSPNHAVNLLAIKACGSRIAADREGMGRRGIIFFRDEGGHGPKGLPDLRGFTSRHGLSDCKGKLETSLLRVRLRKPAAQALEACATGGCATAADCIRAAFLLSSAPPSQLWTAAGVADTFLQNIDQGVFSERNLLR